MGHTTLKRRCLCQALKSKGLWRYCLRNLSVRLHPWPPATDSPTTCETCFYSHQELYLLGIHAQSSESYHANQSQVWVTHVRCISFWSVGPLNRWQFCCSPHISLGLASHSHVVFSSTPSPQDTYLYRARFEQHRNVRWTGGLAGLAARCPCRWRGMASHDGVFRRWNGEICCLVGFLLLLISS